MKPPFQNKGLFNGELKFDPNANLIQRVMSEHIMRSFANDNWEDDDKLT